MGSRQLTPTQSDAVTVCGIATLFVSLTVVAQFALWMTTTTAIAAELSIGVGFFVSLAAFLVANTSSPRAHAAICVSFAIALPLLAITRALVASPSGYTPHAADIVLAAGLYASHLWLCRRALKAAPATAHA
ncbi:MAG: hypothetical protein KF859_10305 [Phycisphaeraceae bacterium]|nr:hypothetical protein [Phycisphaeraceae bacterium]